MLTYDAPLRLSCNIWTFSYTHKMTLILMLLRFKMKIYFPLLLPMLLTTDTTAVYGTDSSNSAMDSKEVSSYSKETSLAYNASESLKQKTLLLMLQTSGSYGSSQKPQYQMSYTTETTQSSQKPKYQMSYTSETSESSQKPQHQMSYTTETTESSQKPQHQMSYTTETTQSSQKLQHQMSNATETTQSSQKLQHQMSNATEATQRSENLNITYTSLESCRQKCGKIIQMPCSCDLKCLIHNNCCEDMALECPDILQQSHANYGHMLQSTVECVRPGVFIISGCPGQSPSNTPQNNISSQKSTENRVIKAWNDKSINGQDAESSNFLLTILKTTLVSDLSTGFVYKNWDTYLCHTNERSQPLLWHAEYPTKFFMDLDGVKDQSSYMEKLPPAYSPPAQLNESTQATRCIPTSVATCRQDVALAHPELLLKCSSFISYTRVVNINSKYYNNKYCALCSFNLSEITPTHPVSNFETRRNEFQFSLLVSISQGTFKLTSYGSHQLPWLHVICTIGDSPEQQTMSCQTDSCNTQFELQPDGTCKELFSITLAVAEDTCPMRSEDIKVLPEFLKCYLTTHMVSRMEIKEVQGPTTVAFDETLRQTLYINTVLVYGEVTTLDVTDRFLLREGKSLSQMARVLRYYRQRSCTPVQSLSDRSYTPSLNSTAMKTRLFSNKDSLHYKENISQTSMSTMCASSRHFNEPLELPPELRCVQYYTNDTMLDNSTSPCFHVFANEGKLMTTSNFYLAINLVCIFVIFKGTQVLIL